VVYTGTHDNDTVRGWWQPPASANATLPAATWPAASTTSTGPRSAPACNSVADLAMFPLQDVLAWTPAGTA
jgi:4-alpha-glucanotransferase